METAAGRTSNPTPFFGTMKPMPSVYDLKPKFQALLRPLADDLAHAGITANAVTLSAMFLSLATGGAICYFHDTQILWLLPVILYVRMALNAIDGMLARKHNQKTSLGAILNELCDVLSDTALYLPLALIAPPFEARAVVVVVILAIISEMTGVIGVQIGASRRYDGPMGKSDRAFVFGALGLALSLNLPIAKAVQPILWIMALLLALTIVNRARRALRELETRNA
jgi:CDP-diacylglycerol---glycerol-3-phosphate 3-phosphatidyltransferase